MQGPAPLKIYALGARNLAPKTDSTADPYLEVFVLGKDGKQIGKPKKTRVLKKTLNPSWNELLEFNVGTNFSGMTIRVWDRHRFRSDKFMGQVTVKFNTERLLSGEERLDNWFPLSRRPGKNELVSGDVHMQVQYGELKQKAPEPKVQAKGKETSDDPGSRGHHPLKTSTKWETSTVQKDSLHVIVAEDDSDHAEAEEEHELVRKGPSDVHLNPTPNSKIQISGLEVSNTSTYNQEAALADVQVNGGKWFFEVRLSYASADISVGWATVKYDPTKPGVGDCWAFNTNRQTLLRKMQQVGNAFGERLNNNDVLGIALDLEKRKIFYYKNGTLLGEAFNDVHGAEDRLSPFIAVGRNARARVNFGKEKFSYPKDEYYPLFCVLSEKEIASLDKLFEKYKTVGIKLSESGDTGDVIKGQGTVELYKDLQIAGDDDIGPLLLAWKLKAEMVWVFTRDEFMNGLTLIGAATIDQIKAKIAGWKQEIYRDIQAYKQFHMFVFDYLRQDKKILLLDEAILVWDMIFKPRGWGLYAQWIQFLKETNKKSISRDEWHQLVEFSTTYTNSVANYDASSWPTCFDEFVDWSNKPKDS